MAKPITIGLCQVYAIKHIIGGGLLSAMTGLALGILALVKNRWKRQRYADCQHENTEFDKWAREIRCTDCGARWSR